VRREKDAILLDGDIKRKKAMGELVVHERGSIRLNDFWEVWWKNHALVHLSENARRNYKTLWSKHVTSDLGRLPMKSLDNERMQTFVTSLSDVLAPSSLRKVMAVLSCVCGRAAEWGYLPSNPVAGVRKPRVAGTQRRGQPLTDKQLQALLKELNPRSRTVVRFLAMTGLRPGELRRLRWADLTDGGIAVLKTKTYRSRVVDWRDGAQALLKEWWLACGKPGPQALVFPNSHGDPWTDNAWKLWQRRVFAPAAKRAGLEGRVPYDLRHTFATTLIKEGKDVIYVARQLGHSPAVCLTVYAHEFESTAPATSAQLPWAVGQ
jgi:integrase